MTEEHLNDLSDVFPWLPRGEYKRVEPEDNPEDTRKEDGSGCGE